jgi:hypothetical protein
MRSFSTSLLLIAAAVGSAGCGDDEAPSSPDAFSGPATVTVDRQFIGLVTSEPPGIYCGKCDDMRGGLPCPQPPSGNVCRFDFEAGTQLTLKLHHYGLYFAFRCAAQDPEVVLPGCALTVTAPTTIKITGAIAGR